MFWEKPAPRWLKRLSILVDVALPLLLTLSVHALFPISQGLIFSLCIFFLLAAPLLNAFFLKKWGRTIGGLLFGLKVVTPAAERLSFKKALLYATGLRTRDTNQLVRRKKGWLRVVTGVVLLGALFLPALPWGSLVPHQYQGEPAQSETGWVSYSHPKGDFYAFFPSTPKEESMEITHPRLDDPLTFYEYRSTPHEGKLYSISYIDFPSMWSFLGSRRILDSAHDLIMNFEGGGQLLHRSSLTHQGYPALQVSYLKATGEVVTARLIRVGNRLYRLSAILPQNAPVEQSFFDTFTVEEK